MAQMCVGGLSGSTGRLKMLLPVSHKGNKIAWANEAKIALFFCDLNRLIAIKVGIISNRYTQHSVAWVFMTMHLWMKIF